MKIMPIAFFGICITVGLSFHAPLVSAADTPELRNQLLSDPVIQKEVIGTAQMAGVIVKHPCPSMKFERRSTVVIYDPFDFDSSGVLTTGSWKETVDATGCGVSRVLNVFVNSEGDKAFHFTAIFPGDTHASKLLQHDTIDYVMDQVLTFGGAAEKDCGVHYIADTQFVALDGPPPRPGGLRQPWHEIWTIETCKKSYRLPIQFTPDSDGTSFKVDQKAIKVSALPLK